MLLTTNASIGYTRSRHLGICTRMTCGPGFNAIRILNINIKDSPFVFFMTSLFIPPDLGSDISGSAVTSPIPGKVERASSNLQYIVYYESLVIAIFQQVRQIGKGITSMKVGS